MAFDFVKRKISTAAGVDAPSGLDQHLSMAAHRKSSITFKEPSPEGEDSQGDFLAQQYHDREAGAAADRPSTDNRDFTAASSSFRPPTGVLLVPVASLHHASFAQRGPSSVGAASFAPSASSFASSFADSEQLGPGGFAMGPDLTSKVGVCGIPCC